MPARWLNSSSDVSRRLTAVLDGGWQTVARPERARQVRQAVCLLLLVWAVLALAQLVLALIPGRSAELPRNVDILNPATRTATPESDQVVDIQRLVGWHLFGEAGQSTAPVASVVETAPATRSELEGIEKGARETRLDLRLVGIVASSEDGLGHAIIEYRNRQEVYAVEDKLPLPGQVTLAKVMPQQVVLDNGGTYELLKLFDGKGLSSQMATQGAQSPASGRASSRPEPASEQRDSTEVSELARDYRDRLYQNPQSLAEVVQVAAVREGDELLGYRISPGRDKAQFELLGLRPGDLVTAINGIPLDDPANTVRLYQAMRSAEEAVFELQRDGQPLSLTVSLAAEQ